MVSICDCWFQKPYAPDWMLSIVPGFTPPCIPFDDWKERLSIRTRNVLEWNGIATWENLFGTKADDLLMMRNFGERSFIELVRKLVDSDVSPPASWATKINSVFRGVGINPPR